jgi:invasion protein IalB
MCPFSRYSLADRRQTHPERLRCPDRQGQTFVAAVTTPLGILLPAGLTLNIDEKELVRFPLRFCNINGCRGQFPLSAAMQKMFSDGKKGRVLFRQPNGRPLRVEFSLKGFAAGFMVLETR